jgi:hypothetical protein
MNGIDNQVELYMTIVFIFVFNYSTPSPVHCYFLFHRSIPPVWFDCASRHSLLLFLAGAVLISSLLLTLEGWKVGSLELLLLA